MIEFTGTEGIIFKRKYLVISDLHIGIEREYLLKGINVPSQTKNLLKKILLLKEKYNVKKLIILGDFKHNIPKISYLELKEVPEFAKKLSENFRKIYITKGNHDGKLEELLKDIKNIKILKALKVERFIFTHGHLKPKLKGKVYVIGHHHFVFNIVSSIGESFYEKVFVFGRTKNYNLFILPAFSNLVGYWEVGNFHGPIAKNIEEYEAITLDGIVIKSVKVHKEDEH